MFSSTRGIPEVGGGDECGRSELPAARIHTTTCVCEKTPLLREPLPWKTAAETPLQPPAPDLVFLPPGEVLKSGGGEEGFGSIYLSIYRSLSLYLYLYL